jgi:16S rRNA (cytosine967-C5)-methyltransferase
MPKPPQKPAASVTPARFEAFTILMELDRSASAHADDLLRGARVTALPPQDRNLCTTLVLGTLRWQIRLDAAIRTLLAKPNAKLDPSIRIALRLGLFQLHYLDRIPAHAAIGESVSLARLAGHQHASRMVNAVLRMLSQSPKPDPTVFPENAAELAAATAHPQWLVERWVAHYGVAAAQAICQNGQCQPELDLRLEDTAVESELAGEGIQLAPGAILSAARRVLSGDVTATEAFRAGRVRIQEEGSQLLAELGGDVTQQPELILDCCAAPGGKTLILAERNRAPITALEVSSARCEALKSRIAASPYAAQIEVVQGDAEELPSEPKYDLILADVPCSGTGTLGRNPEIRHRLQPADLARHHDRQCAILRCALRAGSGRVIYSTCSLEPEENSAVVAEVLAENRDWRQISVAAVIWELREEGTMALASDQTLKTGYAPDGSLTILPGSLGPDVQTDGFFVAILQKLPSISPQ